MYYCNKVISIRTGVDVSIGSYDVFSFTNLTGNIYLFYIVDTDTNKTTPYTFDDLKSIIKQLLYFKKYDNMYYIGVLSEYTYNVFKLLRFSDKLSSYSRLKYKATKLHPELDNCYIASIIFHYNLYKDTNNLILSNDILYVKDDSKEITAAFEVLDKQKFLTNYSKWQLLEG